MLRQEDGALVSKVMAASIEEVKVEPKQATPMPKDQSSGSGDAPGDHFSLERAVNE